MEQPTDYSDEKKMLLRHWIELGAFAYRNYLRKGRGAVLVPREALNTPGSFSGKLTYLPMTRVRQLLESESVPATRRLIWDYFPEKSVVVLVLENQNDLRPYLLNTLPTPLQAFHAALARSQEAAK